MQCIVVTKAYSALQPFIKEFHYEAPCQTVSVRIHIFPEKAHFLNQQFQGKAENEGSGACAEGSAAYV